MQKEREEGGGKGGGGGSRLTVLDPVTNLVA